MGIRKRRHELPPLELLPTFEAAARNLSFTRAGEELFLTQSAVSRQIQALEESLRVRLFERKTRALQLTEAGEIVRRATEDILERAAGVVRTLGNASAVRTVTLSTTPGFASLWLIPRLAGFTNAHPGVDVRTSATNEMVDLGRSGVDLAVRFCRVDSRPGGMRLFGAGVTPVCSPRLVADAKPPLLGPEDLRHFSLLYLADPNAAWFDWNLWFHALGLREFHPARRLHYSHYDQMIQAAVNGQGIALGLDPLVRQLVREGKLVTPFRKAAVPARAWYLVRSPAAAEKPEIDAFVAWLRAEIEADAARPGRSRAAATRRGRRN